MLAQRLPGILPPLRPQEALETTCVHSVAGTLPPNQSLITTRPFRAPHHTISDAGLIGGGTIPKPGEVSMAHHGVLFLDEVLEFKRSVLDGLRQPLEDGTVTVTRVNASLQYPARFMLVVAMNPCPCGHYGDRTRECICTPQQIRRYRGRLSGPLRDRLDIHVEVPAVPVADLGHEQVAERSTSIQKRVADARHVQANRYQDDNLFTNAQLKPRPMRTHCRIDETGRTLLNQAVTQLGLSARAYGRILRVARTIADLADSETIQPRISPRPSNIGAWIGQPSSNQGLDPVSFPLPMGEGQGKGEVLERSVFDLLTVSSLGREVTTGHGRSDRRTSLPKQQWNH